MTPGIVLGRGATLRLAARYAARELRGGLKGLRIVIACLALGVAAIAAVGSLRAATESGLAQDATKLLGGDVEIQVSYRTLLPEARAWIGAAGERFWGRRFSSPDGDWGIVAHLSRRFPHWEGLGWTQCRFEEIRRTPRWLILGRTGRMAPSPAGPDGARWKICVPRCSIFPVGVRWCSSSWPAMVAPGGCARPTSSRSGVKKSCGQL